MGWARAFCTFFFPFPLVRHGIPVGTQRKNEEQCECMHERDVRIPLYE